MKKVQVIPATLRSYTKKLMDSQKKRRVAGYARVSTDHDEQLTSYEAQVDYYTRYIQSRNDWEFVGMYNAFIRIHQEMIGNLSGCIRMKAFQLRIPNTGKDLNG